MSSNTGDHYYVPHGSSLPFMLTLGLFTLALGTAHWLNGSSIGGYFSLTGLAVIIAITYRWFGEVIRESVNGMYNSQVSASFRQSMMWFIFSEVMFFAAFFGALWYIRVFFTDWQAQNDIIWPGYDGGWPTAGPDGPEVLPRDTLIAHGVTDQFSTIGPWGIPLLNTILLMTSSITVTIAHHALYAGKRSKLIFWLAITVVLGATFMYFQVSEYIAAYKHHGLTLGTGIYGATFFLLTGFHGLHVTIGTIILFVILLRCMKGHFKKEDHFAFEAAAWYWHFVDVVWALLFIFVYIL